MAQSRKTRAILHGLATAGVLTLAAGCPAPRYVPEGPGLGPDEAMVPAPQAAKKPPAAADPSSVDVLVGQLCPTAVDGKPAVRGVITKRIDWNSDPEELSTILGRGQAKQFSVLAWDGRRVGNFTVAGAHADASPIAVGAYSGGAACQPAGAKDAATLDSNCVLSMNHCAVAIARLEPAGSGVPYEETKDPTSFSKGGACFSGAHLVVDLDGDEKPEAFIAADFLDPFKAPAQEVLLARGAQPAACSPAFAQAAAVPKADPKGFLGADLVGVVDLDGDKRFELIVAYRYPDKTTWAVFSPRGTVARLELLGESEVWSATPKTTTPPADEKPLKLRLRGRKKKPAR